MHLFVTKKKRTAMLKESLEEMVKWSEMITEEVGDLDLDDIVYHSGDAAKILLEMWFEDGEEA